MKQYVPYQVPGDVDELIARDQQRLAVERGVKLTKVSKSGDVLREWAAIVEAARSLGIVPARTDQAQA